MHNLEVVVVGAGIAGASTALFLHEYGAADVTLIDASYPGSGASSRGNGLMRTHGLDTDIVRLSHAGVDMFRNWADIVGGSCSFNPAQVLWMVAPQDVEALRLNMQHQRQVGARVEFVGPEEIAELAPGMVVDDLGGAALEPDGGTVIGADAMFSLVSRLVDLGVDVRPHTKVLSLLVDQGRAVGVQTAAGDVRADVVVLATGAWTAALLASIAPLPLRAVRASVGMAYLPPDVPRVAFYDNVNDVSFAPRTNGLGMVPARDSGFLTQADPTDFSPKVDIPGPEQGLELIARRLPGIRGAARGDSWAAVDVFSPDQRPIIGPHPEVENLYLNLGGNMRGFKVGPSSGRGLAALIAGGPQEFADQIAPFGAERFQPGTQTKPTVAQYSGGRWT